MNKTAISVLVYLEPGFLRANLFLHGKTPFEVHKYTAAEVRREKSRISTHLLLKLYRFLINLCTYVYLCIYIRVKRIFFDMQCTPGVL